MLTFCPSLLAWQLRRRRGGKIDQSTPSPDDTVIVSASTVTIPLRRAFATFAPPLTALAPDRKLHWTILGTVTTPSSFWIRLKTGLTRRHGLKNSEDLQGWPSHARILTKPTLPEGTFTNSPVRIFGDPFERIGKWVLFFALGEGTNEVWKSCRLAALCGDLAEAIRRSRRCRKPGTEYIVPLSRIRSPGRMMALLCIPCRGAPRGLHPADYAGNPESPAPETFREVMTRRSSAQTLLPWRQLQHRGLWDRSSAQISDARRVVIIVPGQSEEKSQKRGGKNDE